MKIKSRFAPLGALLDARYFPLLFAAAPQAHVIYKWLWQTSDRTTDSWVFAIVGALGFETVYIGAIAWAEDERKKNNWFWVTALAALVFSVLVAIRVFWDKEQIVAILHAGLPIVGFCYTMLIHNVTTQQPEPPTMQPPIATFAADSGSDHAIPLELTTGATASLKEVARSLRGEGLTIPQIASAMQKSERSVSNYLKG